MIQDGKEIFTKWCRCGAPLPDDAPEKALCGPCRRHDNRLTKNCEVMADCMIKIARASHLEAAGDSHPLEVTRGEVIEILKKELR